MHMPNQVVRHMPRVFFVYGSYQAQSNLGNMLPNQSQCSFQIGIIAAQNGLVELT